MAKPKIKTKVVDPLAIIYKNPDETIGFQLHPPGDYTYYHYGLIACDFVRQIAMCFDVDEAAVWQLVDLERHKPTTDHIQWTIKPNKPE